MVLAEDRSFRVLKNGGGEFLQTGDSSFEPDRGSGVWYRVDVDGLPSSWATAMGGSRSRRESAGAEEREKRERKGSGAVDV